MADLGVLSQIPGLAGYLQTKQMNEARSAQDLQGAMGSMGILSQIQARQQEAQKAKKADALQEQFRAELIAANGDMEKMKQTAMKYATNPADIIKAKIDSENSAMVGMPDIVKLNLFASKARAAGNTVLADQIEAKIRKDTATETSSGQEDRNFLLDVQNRVKSGQQVTPTEMGKAMMIYKTMSAPRFDAATGQQIKTDFGAEFDPSRNFGVTVKSDFASEEAAKNFALDAAERGIPVAARGPVPGEIPSVYAVNRQLPPASPSMVATKVTEARPLTSVGKLNADLKAGNISQEQYESEIKKTTKASDEVVKAISEGRMQMPSGFALRSEYWQDVIERVAKMNPSFDATQYGTRAATRRVFATGPEAKNVTALNTVIGHLGTLDEMAGALENKDLRLANTVINRIGYELGDPKVVNFNTAKEAVAEETMRVFRQVGASEAEARRWGTLINSSNSPAQLRGNISTLGELLDSRVQAIGRQYERATGPENPARVDEKNIEVLNRLREGGTTQSNVVKTPDGKSIKFPNATAAEAFKKAHGL